MSDLRCAIIGCGPNTAGKAGVHSIAYAHAEVMKRVKGAKLVAAASRSEKNINDFVGEFPGTAAYRDYKKMLAEQKPDLVSVCAFPPDREMMVNEAIKNGAKAIWIEKPLAESLGAAQRILAAGQKANVRMFVHHQRRYGKVFEWWRDAIREEKIGKLIGIDIVQPGPNLLDFGPHLIDAALFAMGEHRKPTHLLAGVEMEPGSDHQGIPFEKQLIATIHFHDGTRVTVESGKTVPAAVPIIRANGDDGFAELRLSTMPGEGSVFRAQFKGESKITSPTADEHFHHSDDILLFVERAFADIVSSINDGKPTRIEAAEGYRSLEILLGIFESARTRKMLTFPIQQIESPFRPDVH